ncbi:MAG TPA: cupin domain-containing protein [Gammaproteobacteria bacterium]
MFLIATILGTGFYGAPSASQEARGQALDSVAADPAQHKLEFENDMVRVVRIQYAPGASTVMHAHPAHCLTFLTDGKLVITTVDGSTVDAVVTRGSVECRDAVVHSIRNVGGTPVEIVAYEFKNRQKFK